MFPGYILSALFFLLYLFLTQEAEFLFFKTKLNLITPCLTSLMSSHCFQYKSQNLPTAYRALHDMGPACPPSSVSMILTISALGPLVLLMHLPHNTLVHASSSSFPGGSVVVQSRAHFVTCFCLTRSDPFFSSVLPSQLCISPCVCHYWIIVIFLWTINSLRVGAVFLCS